MSDATPEIEDRSAWDKLRTGYRGFQSRLEKAFDELHAAILEKIAKPGSYVPINSSYPRMSMLSSGFPSFRETGFYEFGFRDGSAPRRYIDLMISNGLLGGLGGYRRPTEDFPAAKELSDFLRQDEIGKRFRRPNLDGQESFSEWDLDWLVSTAVERYLQLHGTGPMVEADKRDRIIQPMLYAATFRRKEVRLVVPIALTHFDVDHFRLSKTAFVTRIPSGIQMARAMMRNFGTGADSSVVGAATHAFVSDDWLLEVDTLSEVEQSLRHVSKEATDTIDALFGALRLATGIKTGYAQALWVPKKWVLRYSADLPTVYGAMMRRYPDDFDNFAWTRSGDRVTRGDLEKVRSLYELISGNTNNQVRLALKRMNACMTRSDDMDAILDAAIGLELLLNDKDAQALSYKLRLRSGALTHLASDPEVSAIEMAARVKRIYGVRSKIVHGSTPAKTKNVIDTVEDEYAQARSEATAVLRFVLERLLKHPRYLEPFRIDDELILGPRPDQG